MVVAFAIVGDSHQRSARSRGRVRHNQHVLQNVLPKGQESPYTIVHSSWSRLGSGQSLLVEGVLVVDRVVVLEVSVVVLVLLVLLLHIVRLVRLLFGFHVVVGMLVALVVLRRCCSFCSSIAT